MNEKLPKVGSGYLPEAAVRRLQQAAATPIPSDDPLARIKAINEAAHWVKATYPQYFRKEY